MSNVAKYAATPGTWEIESGRAVSVKKARTAWATAARELLLDVARRQTTIDEGELARAVEVRAGVRTRLLVGYWLPQVLEAVAHQCNDQGEPQLVALCRSRYGGQMAASSGAIHATTGSWSRSGGEVRRCHDHWQWS